MTALEWLAWVVLVVGAVTAWAVMVRDSAVGARSLVVGVLQDGSRVGKPHNADYEVCRHPLCRTAWWLEVALGLFRD